MTLDSTIQKYRNKMNDSLGEAKDYHEIGEHTTSDSTKILCDIRESEYKQAADEYKQIVEWLEELKERQQNDRQTGDKMDKADTDSGL